MHLFTKNIDRKVCPICGGIIQVLFKDECIDPNKINEFTYASRKRPEFMCLRLVRCTDCDLVYAPTPPTMDLLSTMYTKAAYDSKLEEQAAARSYIKILSSYVKHLSNRKAAIDIGAGSGALLPWLYKNGFDPVIGIEPSLAAIEAASPEVRPMLHQGMFSASLLADVKPSLICSFMTLEHLIDPSDFVSEVYKLLEPGGVFAAIVHNWRSPINRLFGSYSPIIDIEHLQLFSPKSIHTLLEKAGFMSIDLLSICNTYSLRYWIRLTPLPTKIKNGIADILNHIDLLDTQISLHVGNMLVVGIKPMKAI